MRHTRWLALVLTLGCHHAGTGQGTLETRTESGASEDTGAVAFSWKSKADDTHGDMQAVLPDGREFDGTFLQVTAQATSMDVMPYYGVWGDPFWGPPWYAGPQAGFVTEYSGQVIAHLRARDGTRMRCRFVLREPISGLQGGGQGDCQLSSNQTVFDARLNRDG